MYSNAIGLIVELWWFDMSIILAWEGLLHKKQSQSSFNIDTPMPEISYLSPDSLIALTKESFCFTKTKFLLTAYIHRYANASEFGSCLIEFWWFGESFASQ